MNAAEINARLDRLAILINERPKYWQNHANAEIKRIRGLIGAETEAEEINCHIGVAKEAGHGNEN